MAVIIGQIYNGKIVKNENTGKESFRFNLAHRKAYAGDPKEPYLFTRSIAHSENLVKNMNNFFSEENNGNGQWVALYGHYDEYTWEPDPNNPNHERYIKNVTVTPELLNQVGVIPAEGSANSFVLRIPIPQTGRQFVVSSFEFAGNPRQQQSRTQTSSQSQSGVVAVATTNQQANPTNVLQEAARRQQEQAQQQTQTAPVQPQTQQQPAQNQQQTQEPVAAGLSDNAPW